MESKHQLSSEHHPDRLERWREVVKAYEQSGQSRQDFCDRNGIKIHQLIYWLSRLKELSHKSLQNSAIQSKPSFTPQTKSSQETFTLQINGIVVRVPKSTPSEKVISIIRCLI